MIDSFTSDFFKDKALQFLRALKQDLTKEKVILLAHWDVDHLCYRVDSLQRYQQLKNEFLNFSNLLIENEVNGRPIATFKLYDPIIHENWVIDVIELPAPKAGKVVPEGFEHVEVVTDLPFNKLIEKYSHLNLDQGGLKKDFNPELEVVLGPRNLKFHSLSLNSVIHIEENEMIFAALKESKILQEFKSFQPVLAGTFPLGIYNEDSDLDILMTCADLPSLEVQLSQKFGSQSFFKTRYQVVDELETLTVNFKLAGVPFEIFAQDKPSVTQQAYLHFLIEERLLKLGGTGFKEKVLAARKNEIKTEPAFAAVLGVKGDPYLELLKLQKLSNLDLMKVIK